MKIIFIVLFFIGYIQMSPAQTLVGTWQLVDQTSCLENNLEDEMNDENENPEALTKEMKSMSSGTANILRFKDNVNGEESLRMFDSKRKKKIKNFLYKRNGTSIHFLDKRSQLLLGSYQIEKHTENSLIISNIKKPCETRIFTKINISK